MSRKDLYAKVKQLGIAEAIKSTYGDNYTRVSNADLETFINKTEASKKVKKSPVQTSANRKKAAFIKLLSILQARKIVSAKEAEEVVILL